MVIVVKSGSREALRLAGMALEGGLAIVYPTDTVYGIGVDARSEDAVGRIFEMKGRGKGKPISIAVADIKMMERQAGMSVLAKKFAKALLPGPYTFVLRMKKGAGLANNLVEGEKIGVRIPDDEFCRALLKKIKFPITSTSANLSGGRAPALVEEIEKSIAEKAALLVDGGECGLKEGSTVIDFTGAGPVVLRKGAGYGRFLEVQKELLRRA